MTTERERNRGRRALHTIGLLATATSIGTVLATPSGSLKLRDGALVSLAEEAQAAAASER